MNTLKVLIVDDERLSRRRLRRMLSHDADLEILGECETGQQALNFLSDERADLLFLDIQMPGMDGFSFLKCLEERSGIDHGTFTIFVSAYDQFALRAFEVHAFDYLLKPYQESRLAATVQHAKAQLRSRGAGQDCASPLSSGPLNLAHQGALPTKTGP